MLPEKLKKSNSESRKDSASVKKLSANSTSEEPTQRNNPAARMRVDKAQRFFSNRCCEPKTEIGDGAQGAEGSTSGAYRKAEQLKVDTEKYSFNMKRT